TIDEEAENDHEDKPVSDSTKDAEESSPEVKSQQLEEQRAKEEETRQETPKEETKEEEKTEEQPSTEQKTDEQPSTEESKEEQSKEEQQEEKQEEAPKEEKTEEETKAPSPKPSETEAKPSETEAKPSESEAQPQSETETKPEEQQQGIVNILIIRKELYKLKREGQLKLISNPTNMTKKAWMIEISFQDPRHGEKQFCAKAIDKLASIEQCTVIYVKPRDPCLSSPCQNSGECIAKKDGRVQCFCKHGATGERCQNRPDPCYDKNFCFNGGTCLAGGYCICPLGVTGMHCEHVSSSCDQNVCQGHGMCIDTPGGKQDHKCLCTNLYTGQQCATNPTPFIDCVITPNDPKCVSCNMSPNPCNTGMCKMHNGSHTCICPEGFVGKDCQTAIDVNRASLNSKFVSPTLAAGSVITCDPLSGITNLDVTANCEFPVHVFWNGDHLSCNKRICLFCFAVASILFETKEKKEKKFMPKDVSVNSDTESTIQQADVTLNPNTESTIQQADVTVNPKTESTIQKADVSVNSDTESTIRQADVSVNPNTESTIQKADVSVKPDTESTIQKADVTVNPDTESTIQKADVSVNSDTESTIQQADVTVNPDTESTIRQADVTADVTVNPATESTIQKADVSVNSDTESTIQQADVTVNPNTESTIQQADVTVNPDTESTIQQADVTVNPDTESTIQQADVTESYRKRREKVVPMKPVVKGTSSFKDMKIDRHSEVMLKMLHTTNTAGFDKTLTAIVQLVNPDNQQFQIGMHVVCLFVKQGTVQTDYRCFRINVEFDVLKLRKRLTKGDGRLFESPTLPGGSEIVCVKDKLCHINLYTEYKSSPHCLPPVFQSDAPCTVLGPNETEFSYSGTVCHSDIAYSTGGLAVGTKKEVCFQATQDGETRCFLLHIIADSK
ncbi:Hypothetical predicted protein, partial [Mytilus galloprovincialis]